ncbi:unnamed protein product [Linum trigynum]|uniref:Uncharacterized protein n=1 Tax=Linum trigynum TaxID=586398 RepID=A0AAV2D7G6_9ROSI
MRDKKKEITEKGTYDVEVRGGPGEGRGGDAIGQAGEEVRSKRKLAGGGEGEMRWKSWPAMAGSGKRERAWMSGETR